MAKVLSSEERAELRNSKPAQPKGTQRRITDEDVDFMNDEPLDSPARSEQIQKEREKRMNTKISNQADQAFTKSHVKRIGEVVTETDLVKPLTGLNDLEDVKIVVTKLRIGKGDQYDAEREVAYFDAYRTDTQEDLTVVSSAYYVVAQLKAVNEKKEFPVTVIPSKVKIGKNTRWELT